MDEQSRPMRSVAIVTGAHGGMGVACSRLFGRRHRLVITDRDADRLEALRRQLEADGADIATAIAGDLSSPSVIAEIVDRAHTAGPFGALVHTAGLSPSLASWQAILEVNLVTSMRLLDAVEPLLRPGAVGALIASIAGHQTIVSPQLATAVEALLESGDRSAVEAAILQAPTERLRPGAAYSISKYGVLRLVEKRARSWANAGARIVSISPGLIDTPMGRREADAMEEAAQMLRVTPAGRWGTPLDIANAAEFLCSDLASFITGCDLRVDGGLIGALAAEQLTSASTKP